MKALVAWRILAHEKGRSGLAISGIMVAIILMFLQIGFYISVPQGGLLFYDAMRFDLMLTSSAYVVQTQSSSFPRRRLYQALAQPEVSQASPLYHRNGRWLDHPGGRARDVFIMAFRPDDAVFDIPEIDRRVDALRRPDTILVDASSRREFGALDPGRRIEVEQRAITIGGTYRLGTGFVGLGVAVTSDLNFMRMFPNQTLASVNLGLITLKHGADPDRVASRLREIMAADTLVFTRRELIDHEIRYWVTSTSVGLIFGFGVIVAVAVGLLILNQTLTTQIVRRLPQFATLKAMGYSDHYLGGIVATLAMIMSTVSYVPAVALSLAIYWLVRHVTLLPVEMTPERLISVLALAWGVSAASALFALRVLRRADPVELL